MDEELDKELDKEVDEELDEELDEEVDEESGGWTPVINVHWRGGLAAHNNQPRGSNRVTTPEI